jgi:SAM-dependent methyltransferase
LLGVDSLLPPYFDDLIDAYRRGLTQRSVHLGYWGNGDDGDFAGAQARLDQVVVTLADMAGGQSVLDVGCGFGGTIARINDTYQNMRLTGINIDARQIEICRSIASRAGNVLAWRIADACRLPFAGAAFDRVFSVEAMFHFASRRQFFAEAARVLNPGGMLAGTDILISPLARSAPFPIDAILQAGFGPWPDVWGSDADHAQLAHAAGLSGEIVDITAQVAPSYRYTAPPQADPRDANAPAPMRASAALRWLHEHGWLRYVCFRFERPRMDRPR